MILHICVYIYSIYLNIYIYIYIYTHLHVCHMYTMPAWTSTFMEQICTDLFTYLCFAVLCRAVLCCATSLLRRLTELGCPWSADKNTSNLLPSCPASGATGGVCPVMARPCEKAEPHGQKYNAGAMCVLQYSA